MIKIKHLNEKTIVFTDGEYIVRSVSYDFILNEEYKRLTNNPFVLADYENLRKELKKLKPEIFI